MSSAPHDASDDSNGVRLEALISEIWCQVLDLPSVARDADFFELGGDSLLATLAISRLTARTGLQASVRVLFENATPAELAAALQDCGRQDIEALAPQGSSKPPSAARLSFSQERMWFMHALAGASAAYHVPLAIRLRGKLDVKSMHRALQRVVRRHESLRSTFVGFSTGVTTQCRNEFQLELREASFRQATSSTALSQAHAFATEFINGSFDLERGPLLRAAILHIAADDAVLLLVAHHIVCDQWSSDIILREIAGFYREEATGVPFGGTAPVSPYSEYAEWHRSRFTSDAKPELVFWKKKLANLDPVVLNADYPRPPQQTFRGAKLRVPFPAELAAQLRSFGATNRTSLAMVMATALKVLLVRHTNVTDIAIGMPIANRHHLAAETLVGTLVNTLVVRTDLSDDPTLRQALLRVRESSLEAFDHQDAPLESIVKALRIPRDASRSPLFSVMFNMLNTPLGEVDFGGLSWSRFDVDKKASQFDLTVTIDAAHDRSVCFEYAQDLLAPASIELLARHYMRLLQAATLDADAPISQLAMLDDEERARVGSWSAGRSEPRSGDTVIDLLERSCKRTPDAIAVTVEDQSFTYQELDEVSSRIAAMLSARGVGRNSRVGLCMHRSAQLLIAQWAVLKSGAAYVPLDPSYPRERLMFMARDAHLSLVVTDASIATMLAWPDDLCPVFDIDAALSDPRPPHVRVHHERPEPQDASYVIYTSGSTGQPKGVVVSHGAVVNLLRSMASEPGLTSRDAVLAITTLSFDIAVIELLLPWSVGARVVLATRDQAADAEILQRLIDQHSITVMQATPSTWRMLIDANWKGAKNLKALVGGEPLSRELATALLSLCRETWNMYGPTETTVWSSCWKVRSPELGISLGRPITNTQIYVLDDNRQICPIGVPGEIWIGGDGLANEYFQRPDLTRARFVTLVFPGDSQPQRLYRTGDRGRWRHDGALEHLGRIDNQVKVRGHRIELGEIEAQLRRHSNVRDALVRAQQGQAGDVRLVAYVVPRQTEPSASDLRSFLRERLPDYMLPQWFMFLGNLPTLPNGKMDLKGLPDPREATPVVLAQPRTEMERSLCRIWREVLNVEQVGIHDNLFDLGGHSILCVRLVSRIRVELRRACTLPMLFRFPTVAMLASALEAATDIEENSLIALQPAGSGPPLFCICGIHLYQELANCLAPDVPVYGVFVPMEMEYVTGSQSPQAATPTVPQLAAEYIRAIRRRQPQGPYRLLGFSFGGVLAFEMAQQLSAHGQSVSFLAILDSEVPERRKQGRGGRLDHRLRVLRQRIGRRVKSHLSRFGRSPAMDEHLAEAREDRYLLAIRSYVASMYSGPAIFVRATDEPAGQSYGWESLVRRLETYDIPGDHLSILRAPGVNLLVKKLRRHLST